MNDFLSILREKNPALRLVSVLDDEFKAYGRVLEGYDCAALAACASVPTEALTKLSRLDAAVFPAIAAEPKELIED